MDRMAVTGRQLVFQSDRTVAVEEYPVPTPGLRQILVEVSRSCVSAGTEMNFFRSNPPTGPLQRATLGYMTVGRVAQVGSGVSGYAPGDRVLTCGHHCSHWLVDLDDQGSSRWYITHLPDAIPDDVAGFTILGDVALHGVRRASLQIDESVAVFGAGIVGQLTVQFARLSGAYPIVAVDLYAARLDLARQSGATHVVNPAHDDPVGAIREATGGGAQAVFHCAPVAQVLQTALAAAADRGKVVLTGSAPGTAAIGLQVELLRHELSIIGVYETGLTAPHPYWPWTRQRNRQACLRLLAAGQLRLDQLITHVVPYTEAQAIVELLLGGGGEWLGVVFRWD
jgi:2-desacetyl-2-hydroxyethyl bacteriochlorophyllide A dehydrogenase